MAAGDVDPTVHRRRLRNELRQLRETAHFTQKEVVRAMDWSLSKLIRIESGAVTIATNDLRALLAHYGVTDRERVEDLVEVGRSSRERSWWSAYRGVVSPEYLSFLGLESSSSIVRNYEPLLIPGLLQTEEYARVAIRIIQEPDPSPAELDVMVDLRMRRQEVLERPDPPQLHCIVDESVIRRRAGGDGVMRRQLTKLLEMSSRPNVVLRVVPFGFGLYRWSRAGFVVFEFPGPEDSDILYLEGPTGEMIIRELSPEGGNESALDPATLLEAFWQFEQVTDQGESRQIIEIALSSSAASRSS
jgi:transcriptional regulator with XRE-family HTH domain